MKPIEEHGPYKFQAYTSTHTHGIFLVSRLTPSMLLKSAKSLVSPKLLYIKHKWQAIVSPPYNLREIRSLLEKWFPLQSEQGHSSYFRSFQQKNKEEGETE